MTCLLLGCLAGRSKEERFEDEAALRACVEATVETRLRHGYQVVSDSRQEGE